MGDLCCASWPLLVERVLRAAWLGMGDGKVGTHIPQPQQCHVPSGAADGQWLPSSFSASGRKDKRKEGYQVPIPLSIALPHAMPQSTKGLQPCQGDCSILTHSLSPDQQHSRKRLPAEPSFANLR